MQSLLASAKQNDLVHEDRRLMLYKLSYLVERFHHLKYLQQYIVFVSSANMEKTVLCIEHTGIRIIYVHYDITFTFL